MIIDKKGVGVTVTVDEDGNLDSPTLNNKPIVEQVEEIISNTVWQPLAQKSDIPIAAAEIDLLYNQQDKTLAKLAADYGIPLWQAMECARIGERAAMAEVEEKGKEYLQTLDTDYSSEALLADGAKALLRRLKV